MSFVSDLPLAGHDFAPDRLCNPSDSGKIHMALLRKVSTLCPSKRENGAAAHDAPVQKNHTFQTLYIPLTHSTFSSFPLPAFFCLLSHLGAVPGVHQTVFSWRQ